MNNPNTKIFQAFKNISGIDNIMIQYLLSFIREIGSDGNLSRMDEKLSLISTKFQECEPLVQVINTMK